VADADPITWRQELAPTLRLALPMMLGQLGLMAMGLVDTAVIGRLGPAAVAAAGAAHAVHMVTLLLGLGLLWGLDRTTAFAQGAGRSGEAPRLLWHGLLLATLGGVVLTALSLAVCRALPLMGLDAEVTALAQPYLQVMSLSLLPTLLFTAARQVLQGLGQTRAATVTMLLANGVNLAGNLWFVEGGLGVAPMGIAGSGLATLLSRTAMALVLLWVAVRELGWPAQRRIDRAIMGELLRLGWPASVQMLFEGGVFSLVNLLAVRLGPVPGAASQVALQVASFTFMVPLGLGGAGSVRVGRALGAGDASAARRAGRVALGLAVGLMSLLALLLVVASAPVMRLFSQPEAVLVAGRPLLLVAAFFQLFDGAQVTLAGLLRGAGDTMSAMVANLCGHWLVGLPLGALLCYRLGMGATGLWIGLATGLGFVALALLLAWRRRIGRLCAGGAMAPAPVAE